MIVGLAAVVAVLTAIGYGLIALSIASPMGEELGTLAAPEGPGARAVLLDDGRPAFVVRSGGGVLVVDARVPLEPGVPGRLVGWCGQADGVFIDVVGGGSFGPDGTLIGGPGTSGLLRHPVTLGEDGSTLTVGREPERAPTATGERAALDCPADTEWLTHEPTADEIFDPSVAAEEEPPGWVWLEGRLEQREGQVVLCDDVAAEGCARGALVRGIDPAKLAEQPEAFVGYFIGRVRDGAVEELHLVPGAKESR
mgnify:CR=1 FL=1